jgi:hypothetical protein
MGRRRAGRSARSVALIRQAALAGADFGDRDHRDRAIVITRIGDRDRSEATRGGR